MTLVESQADEPMEQDWVQGFPGIIRGAADEQAPRVHYVDLTLFVVKLL